MQKTSAPRYRGSPFKYLNHTLFAYTQKVNGEWVRKQAARKRVPYSLYLDALIEAKRTKKRFSAVLARYTKKAA